MIEGNDYAHSFVQLLKMPAVWTSLAAQANKEGWPAARFCQQWRNDAEGVSFVSVTQQFNTTNSMWRLGPSAASNRPRSTRLVSLDAP